MGELEVEVVGVGEVADEGGVGVGFGAAEIVMDVDHAEDEADFFGGFEHGAE